MLLVVVGSPCLDAAFVSDEPSSDVTEEAHYVHYPEADPARGFLVSWEAREPGTVMVRSRIGRIDGSIQQIPHHMDAAIVKAFQTENINSFDQYQIWLRETFHYKKDSGSDAWADPAETLAAGEGDCEDFAFLNAAVLRVFGYTPKVLALYDGLVMPSHAVCVFEDAGTFNVFDNTKLKTTRARTIQELREILLARTTFYALDDITAKDPSLSNPLTAPR